MEQKGDAEAQSTDHREGKERGGASDLLEAILDRDNLNRGYKRVREELLQINRDGSYNPSPVRRKEIPKPGGGVRKLGIPTVVD